MPIPRPLPRPSRNSRHLVPAATLGWLLISPGLPAQTPEITTSSSTTAPSAAETGDTGKPIFEEWSVLFLDGKQCGFASTITTQTDTPAGPHYHTVAQEEFVVKRMDIDIKITDTSKVDEDADGGVLDFDQETSGAGSDIESSGVRQGDDLVVTSRGQTQHYQVARLAALGPEKVRRLSNAVPLKAGQPFSFSTFSSDYPQAPVVLTGTIEGQDERNVRGTERNLWKLTTETNVMPGLIATSWVDDKSQDVESITVIPGIGDLHEYVTDRAECMKQPEGAEIFATTLVRPQKAIPAPKEQAQAIYRLTCTTDTGKPLVLWNGGEQKVLTSSPGMSEVEVTVPNYIPADVTWQLPHADTPELHTYLQPTSYLEVNSPEIQELAKEAVGDEKNPVKAAHLIETFVRNYITKKDLNIGFASAQETAKSREGDCTEHAVLCAAIARAAGLPSRCVVGFGYIPPGEDEPTISDTVDTDTGIFGFHMWAEAWIGPDQWVAMDAALNGFDVGHIAIIKTALEEVNPLLDLNTPILQLMQNLQIEVVRVTPKPPPAAPPQESPASTTPSPTSTPLPTDTSSPSASPPATPRQQPLSGVD